ncbi:Exosome complex component RRP43 [Coemansia sp. RSA 2603]|nr:Exosome complex component RRP43 [Coemansia sp. RSA 2603]
MSQSEKSSQITFAMQTFERIHPVEFQRRFLTQDTRLSGREFSQFRALHIVKGSISTAQGSATVRMGNTIMVCGIKAEVCEPDVKRPTHGYLTTNFELSPMCSARFRSGPPSEEAQVASEHIHRLITPSVDLTSLCIEENKVVWALSADIVCIKYDGNVLDAAIVALVAALENLKLPEVKVDPATGVVEAGAEEGVQLGIVRRLFPATFALVDDNYLVADADDAEEQMTSASLLVVLDEQGQMVNVWKRGAGIISRDTIAKCIAAAAARKSEIEQALSA